MKSLGAQVDEQELPKDRAMRHLLHSQVRTVLLKFDNNIRRDRRRYNRYPFGNPIDIEYLCKSDETGGCGTTVSIGATSLNTASSLADVTRETATNTIRILPAALLTLSIQTDLMVWVRGVIASAIAMTSLDTATTLANIAITVASLNA